MAQQTVNIGTLPNDGTGDPLRTAFDKINDNFDEIYTPLFWPLTGEGVVTGDIFIGPNIDANHNINIGSNQAENKLAQQVNLYADNSIGSITLSALNVSMDANVGTFSAANTLGFAATNNIEFSTGAISRLLIASDGSWQLGADGDGTAGQVIMSNGSSGPPTWETVVVGPGSSTNNAIARFNGTTGALIKNSGVTLDDSNVVGSATTLSFSAASGITSQSKHTFSPTSTLAGLNVGSVSSNPSSLSNGDIWYNSSTNTLTARIEASTNYVASTAVADAVINRVPFYLNGTGKLTSSSSLGYNSGTGVLSVPMANLSTTATRPALALGAGIPGDPTNTNNFEIWSSTVGPAIRTKVSSTIYNVAITENTAANRIPIAIDGNGRFTSNSGLTFSSSILSAPSVAITGTLSANGSVGTAGQVLTSNGAGAASWSTILGVTDGDKGDITVSSTGTVWTVDNNAITYAKIQDVSATSRILGRITAGAGDIEELTGTQATTLLDTFTSALKGLAPASGGGTTNFLRADGSWAAPPNINSAANNEITKSNGTNIVGTGLFTSATGVITLTGNFTVTATGDSTINSQFGLGVHRTDATNNAVTTALTISHQTSGVPQLGIGARMDFQVETASSNIETAASIEVVSTIIDSTFETFDVVLKSMRSGTNENLLRFSNNGSGLTMATELTGTTGKDFQIIAGSASASSGNRGGHIVLNTGTGDGAGIDGNIEIFGTSKAFNIGEKIIRINNATTAPTGNGANCFFMWSEGGEAHFMSDDSRIIRLRPGTGWTDPTGDIDRATFDTATVTLQQLAERVGAIIIDLKNGPQILQA